MGELDVAFFTPITSRVPVSYQTMLCVFLAVSWFTGLAFFVLDTFVQIEGEYGPMRHPAQQPALSIHGASAFLMMMMIGAIALNHVPLSWRLKTLRFLGISLLVAFSVQIGTAYVLYYASGELLREVVKYVHLVVGLSLPLWLLVHITTARRRRKASTQTV